MNFILILHQNPMPIFKTLRAAAVISCLLYATPSLAQTVQTAQTAQAAPAEPVYTPKALQDDFRFMREEIDRIHPEPGLFTSRETLRKAYEQVEAQLQQPLTRDQAWRVFATLNPLFADAHMFVVEPDWKARTRTHLQAGGVLFPYDVQVTADGEMVIRAELDGSASALAGMRIERINGVPASRVAHELLARTAGETPALRANILSRRMWADYGRVFGTPRAFDLVVARPDGPGHLRIAGSSKLPAVLEMGEPSSFKKTFQFELLPGNAALLTINTFLWPDEQAFKAFTRDAFTRIRDARVTTLIIDVRENTGGNDSMWKFGILPYLADKPFRNGSSYIKKVIAGRASGLEKVGDVVPGFGDTWIAPELNNPLRFSGKTYVLVGRLTYSSAVLFSNVVQDFGFARLAGAGGYARTRQTGGVEHATLPNTHLEITIPRFVLDRPSGEREPALVHPDIVVPDSPFDRMVAVNALLDTVRGARLTMQK
jgi:C-terminal processing protease CtpA/Prc